MAQASSPYARIQARRVAAPHSRAEHIPVQAGESIAEDFPSSPRMVLSAGRDRMPSAIGELVPAIAPVLMAVQPSRYEAHEPPRAADPGASVRGLVAGIESIPSVHPVEVNVKPFQA